MYRSPHKIDGKCAHTRFCKEMPLDMAHSMSFLLRLLCAALLCLLSCIPLFSSSFLLHLHAPSFSLCGAKYGEVATGANNTCLCKTIKLLTY